MDKAPLHDINFFTTYKCNSRCGNCHIWKGSLVPPSTTEMDDRALERLFADPLFGQCSGTGLAGGEPTIAPFAWRLLERLPENKQVTVTTNALTSGRLVEFFRQRQDPGRFTVQLSLDGIGETNDRIRGVAGAYQKTMALLAEVEKLGIRRLLSFTVNASNFDQLLSCYELACCHGAEFSARIAYSGGAYSNKDSSGAYFLDDDALGHIDEQLADVISREIEKDGAYPAKLIFFKKMTDYYRGKLSDIPCFAMQSGMVVDLYGNVFPNCPVMMKPIGNLNEAGLSEIWQSEKAEKMRGLIADFACGGCWNDCQVITNIALNRDFFEEEYAELKKTACNIEALSIPLVLDFNRGETSLLLVGWYGLEGDRDFCYRWTGQRFSFLVPGGVSAIELFAMAPDNLTGEQRKLEVFLDGERKLCLVLETGEWKKYLLEFQAPLTGVTRCQLRLNSYYCPMESGHGNDLRRLGVAVNKIVFS